MANSDSPNGFNLLGRIGDGVANVQEYDVDSSNGTAIFIGDPVIAEADGNIAPATAGAGTNVIGFVLGCFNSDREAISFLAASTAGFITVCDDDHAIMGIQSDSGTNVDSSDRFATADFVAGAGSTALGRSRYELDASDIGTGAQLRILDKIDTPNNNFGEDHVQLKVIWAEHLFKTTTSI